MSPRIPPDSTRRARHAFWALVGLGTLAAGSLSSSLEAPASPGSGLRVAASGLVLIAAVGLAARVLFALDRARRRARQVSERATTGPSSLTQKPTKELQRTFTGRV